MNARLQIQAAVIATLCAGACGQPQNAPKAPSIVPSATASQATASPDPSVTLPPTDPAYASTYDRERSTAFLHVKDEIQIGIQTPPEAPVRTVVPVRLSFPPTPGAGLSVIVRVVGHRDENDELARSGGRTLYTDAFSLVDVEWPSSFVFGFEAQEGAAKYEVQVAWQPLGSEASEGGTAVTYVKSSVPPADEQPARYVFEGYDFASSTLPGDQQRELKKLVAHLVRDYRAGKLRAIEVVGHACTKTRSERSNLQISLNRARAVQDIMMAKGLPKDTIKIVGEGSRQPRCPSSKHCEPVPSDAPEELLRPQRRTEVFAYPK